MLEVRLFSVLKHAGRTRLMFMRTRLRSIAKTRFWAAATVIGRSHGRTDPPVPFALSLLPLEESLNKIATARIQPQEHSTKPCVCLLHLADTPTPSTNTLSFPGCLNLCSFIKSFTPTSPQLYACKRWLKYKFRSTRFQSRRRTVIQTTARMAIRLLPLMPSLSSMTPTTSMSSTHL